MKKFPFLSLVFGRTKYPVTNGFRMSHSGSLTLESDRPDFEECETVAEKSVVLQVVVESHCGAGSEKKDRRY